MHAVVMYGMRGSMKCPAKELWELQLVTIYEHIQVTDLKSFASVDIFYHYLPPPPPAKKLIELWFRFDSSDNADSIPI